MTDGTTGFPVAPTEAEMNQVQSILRRAVDAIVGMSQLHADVETLRHTVSALQADTERLRNTNASLDEAVTRVRQERDIALAEVQKVSERAALAEARAQDLQQQVNDLSFARNEAERNYNEAMQGWDQVTTERNATRAELAEANAKLDAINDLMRGRTSEPKSEPIAQTEPWRSEPSPIDPMPWANRG